MGLMNDKKKVNTLLETNIMCTVSISCNTYLSNAESRNKMCSLYILHTKFLKSYYSNSVITPDFQTTSQRLSKSLEYITLEIFFSLEGIIVNLFLTISKLLRVHCQRMLQNPQQFTLLALTAIQSGVNWK